MAKVFPLSEGVFTIGHDKEFVPFNIATDILTDRPTGSLLVEIQPFLVVTDRDVILLDTGLGYNTNAGLPQIHENLAKHGFDPLMGARPMQRIIQDTVRKALADELLFGKLAQGGHVDVDIDADGKVQLDFDVPALPGKAAKKDVAPAEEI